METVFVEKTREIRENLKELEERLKVKITLKGRIVTIEGSAIDEYEANIVLSAMGFGYSAKTALTLKEEDMQFVKLPIKNFTRRKDLKTVRGRVIGREGKTKRTIESVAECDIIVNKNDVGVIGNSETIEEAKTALQNLIRGTKEGNIYKFLEKLNTDRKKRNFI